MHLLESSPCQNCPNDPARLKSPCLWRRRRDGGRGGQPLDSSRARQPGHHLKPSPQHMTRVLKIESKMRAPSVLSRNSEICRTKRVNGTKVSSHLRLQHNRSLKAFAFDYVELQIYRETPLVQRDIKGSKNCLPLECSRRPKRHRLTLSWPCPHTSTVEARGH